MISFARLSPYVHSLLAMCPTYPVQQRMRPDSKVGGNDPWLENPQLHCLTETTHMYVILRWQELKDPCFQLDRTCRPPQCYVFRRRGPLMRSGTISRWGRYVACPRRSSCRLVGGGDTSACPRRSSCRLMLGRYVACPNTIKKLVPLSILLLAKSPPRGHYIG